MNNTKLLREQRKSFINGNHISRLPFGYSRDEDGNIVKNDNIIIVGNIFKLRKEGFGYQKIASSLKLVDENNYPKKIFVKNILKNPFYAGFVRFNDKIIEGNHEKMIEIDLFLEINNSNKIEEFINN